MMKWYSFVLLLVFLLVQGVVAQTLGLISNIRFPTIEFAMNPLAGQIRMGTNGAMTYPTGASGASTGIPGQVQITGTVGSAVSIRCRRSATLLGPSGATLAINPAAVSIGTGQTYSAAPKCNGLTTTVITHTLTSNASQNILYLAGQLQSNGVTLVNGSYSISTGNKITVRVVYI